MIIDGAYSADLKEAAQEAIENIEKRNLWQKIHDDYKNLGENWPKICVYLKTSEIEF